MSEGCLEHAAVHHSLKLSERISCVRESAGVRGARSTRPSGYQGSTPAPPYTSAVATGELLFASSE